MKYIAWTDLEATGLSLKEDILEVAVVVTDFQLNHVDSFHRVIPIMPQASKMNDFVRSMHEKSGLLADIRAIDSHLDESWRPRVMSEIDEALESFIRRWLVDDKVLLGGSSVHYDNRYLEQHFPLFYSRLHHRLFDVSAAQTVFNVALGQDLKQGFTGGHAHRAMDDVRNSIERARVLFQAFATVDVG